MSAGRSATSGISRQSRALRNTRDALRAQFEGQKIAPHRQSGRWIVFGIWTVVMCALGAAYVYAVLGRLHVFTVAVWLAIAASVSLGCVAGYRRDRNLLFSACTVGTLVLTAALECGWVATFFVPTPGGSGGIGEIIAPFFLAAVGIPFFLVVMAVILGIANLLGIAIAWRQRPSGPES
jgi:hypothetical protein